VAMTSIMPRETEMEILYSQLKEVIGEKYEKMKGFPIMPGREIDISDYLALLYFHKIDNNTNIKDIIAEYELEHLKNDMEINLILNRIRQLQ
jgi:hypothetical protein